jgi:hypothetical protein
MFIKAEELLSKEKYQVFEIQVKNWLRNSSTNSTKNTCFKSIEKHDSEGKLTRIILSEFDPKTSQLYGKALVLTKHSFKLLYMKNNVCSQPKD